MRRLAGVLLIIALLAIPCGRSWGATPANVLVIVNDNSPSSLEIGSFYASERGIPSKNVVHIKCRAEESVDFGLFIEEIQTPVRDYLRKTGLNSSVDYLVLTKGIPIRSADGRSVDGMLMCMEKDFDFRTFASDSGVPNPYFGRRERFSHRKFGFYLATRLDGYTVADAKSLVRGSMQAIPRAGLFLINPSKRKNVDAYIGMNQAMARARDSIARRGFLCELGDGDEFIGGRTGLMGYFSWGSNDGAFDLEKYRSNKFAPGGIAETAVSTSARTFERTTKGQSLIADLIESGATGVKGYVSEPYLAAIADPEILFDRYLDGFNLAESFYSASRFILWKDLVVGDPLCAPYSREK
jgi:uncharacterized protein (TIGR03790 family)